MIRLHSPGLRLTVQSFGQTITGLMVSKTVTVEVQLEVLPQESAAVKIT